MKLAKWPRVVTIGVAVTMTAVALIGLGLLDLQRRPPARLILSAGGAWDYVRTVERQIALAEHRVWVMVYVMRLGDAPDPAHPVEVLGASLAAAQARGLDVRICLDRSKSWDNPDEIEPKHVDPAAWLRARGVHVVEDELTRISHAKVVLIDDDIVVVGSHNWTFSALTLNREASVLLRDRALLRELERELFSFIPGWEKLPQSGSPEVREPGSLEATSGSPEVRESGSPAAEELLQDNAGSRREDDQ